MTASWKTTTAGISAVVVLVGQVAKALFDGDPSTNVDWGITVPALIAAIGLLFARDNNVTSEQAGAK